MPDGPGRIYVTLPKQATIEDSGPFHAVNRGLMTGVYCKKKGSWAKVGPFVNCDAAASTQPYFRNFDEWNSAAWFCNKGTIASYPADYPPLARPRRKIQCLQVLSEAFPPGTVILLEDDDDVLRSESGDTRPVTVEVMRKAGAGLFTTVGNTTSAANVICSTRKSEHEPEPRPQILPSQAVKIEPAPRLPTLVEAVLDKLPDDESTCELDQPYSFSAYPHYFSPNGTLIEDITPRRTPEDGYHWRPALRFDPPPRQHAPGSLAGPSHQPNPDSQPDLSQDDAPSNESVQREVNLRIRLLEDMRNPDGRFESSVNEHFIVEFLASVNLSRDGIRRVRRAAAELDG
ncbi:hypothetical protein FRC07_010510 [Ceratobasidium sp. 392]|nr:hypothetical protein FRC07_010510 [Ceratobasidium sp. 392]